MGERKVDLVIEGIKSDLGREFSKALAWFKVMHPGTKMNRNAYKQMQREWLVCKSIETMIEVQDSISSCTVESEYLDKTFRFCSNLFNGPKSAKSDDEKRTYIASCMELFNRQTTSEVLHKKNIPLLKLSLDDIEFDANGNAFFDSRKASVFVGPSIQRNSVSMRWVATAEDGISRLLMKYGLSQMVIYLGEQGKNDQEKTNLLATKENIFLLGITDRADGKHYMCSSPSASSTRSADFPFIEADNRVIVYDLWCEITGFKNMKELLHGLGTKVEIEKLLDIDVNDIPEFKTNKDIVETRAIVNGKETIVMVFRENDKIVGYKINLAKLKARIAMRGSNSIDLYQTKNEDVLYKLKYPKVDYVKDPKGTTSVPTKRISQPGVLKLGDQIQKV